MTDEEQEKIEKYADAICDFIDLVLFLVFFGMCVVIFFGVFAWAWGQL